MSADEFANLDALQLEPLSILLKKVLNAPHGYIYLQGIYPWSLDSLGLIYFMDVYDDKLLETEQPKFVAVNELSCVMQIGRAEDAIRNAFFQKDKVSVQELVDCFNFHYKNSGYLDLR